MCVNRIKYETYRSSPSNLIKIYNCWKIQRGDTLFIQLRKIKKSSYLATATSSHALWIPSYDTAETGISLLKSGMFSLVILYSNLYSSEPWARCSMSFSTLRGISNVSYMSLLSAHLESLFVNHEPSDMSFFSFSTFRALWLWGNIMQKACFSYLCL